MNTLYNPETDKEAMLRKMIEDAQMVDYKSALNMTVDPSAGIDNTVKVANEIGAGDIVPEIANAVPASASPVPASASPFGAGLTLDNIASAVSTYEPIDAPAMTPLQKQYVPMQDNAVQALSPTGIMELIEKARQMGQM